MLSAFSLHPQSYLIPIYLWPCCEWCGTLVPRPGNEAHPLQWNHGVLTTGWPGKSPYLLTSHPLKWMSLARFHKGRVKKLVHREDSKSGRSSSKTQSLATTLCSLPNSLILSGPCFFICKMRNEPLSLRGGDVPSASCPQALSVRCKQKLFGRTSLVVQWLRL